MEKRILSFILGVCVIMSCGDVVKANDDTEGLGNKNYYIELPADCDYYAKKEGETVETQYSMNGVNVTIEDSYIENEQGKERHELIGTYDVESFVDGSQNCELIENEFVSLLKGGKTTIETTDTDIGVSVRVTLKLTYSVITRDNVSYVSIDEVRSTTKACNGSTTSDVGDGISIKSNKLTVGQNGWKLGGGQTENQSVTFKLDNCACTKTFVPSGWTAIADTAMSTVGANQVMVLKRGTNSWKLSLDISVVK